MGCSGLQWAIAGCSRLQWVTALGTTGAPWDNTDCEAMGVFQHTGPLTLGIPGGRRYGLGPAALSLEDTLRYGRTRERVAMSLDGRGIAVPKGSGQPQPHTWMQLDGWGGLQCIAVKTDHSTTAGWSMDPSDKTWRV